MRSQLYKLPDSQPGHLRYTDDRHEYSDNSDLHSLTRLAVRSKTLCFGSVFSSMLCLRVQLYNADHRVEPLLSSVLFTLQNCNISQACRKRCSDISFSSSHRCVTFPAKTAV